MSSSGVKISKRVEKELHQTKVVIRRLPPDFTEDKLKELITPFPTYTYFYFSSGDKTLGTFGCSRAYIAFENEDEIVSFRDQYDGMLLESEKGGKYRAIVEFAPYQGVPKKAKRKIDARCGTIDKDADFQTFMQSLETQPEPRPSINLETYLEELKANQVADVQVTPLIEYLREKMSGRGGRSRGRIDAKRKRGKGETSSAGKSKGYKSSKGGSSADAADTASSTKGSKSKEYSSKGKREKKDSESMGRTGSSSKLSSGAQEETGSQSKSGASHRSTESKQDRKEKYRGGSSSERKEGGGRDGDTAGEKEGRRGKQRNRDRPDRSIYIPRNRDQGGGGGGEGRESKESSREYYRGGRGKQDRYDNSNDYGGGGRPRSRGRGRGYRRNSDQAYESGYQDK